MWHQRCVTIGPTICTDAKAQVLRTQQETADGRFKYDYEITPGALTTHSEYQSTMILQCSKRDPKGLFVGFHATAAGTEALEGNESPRREEVEEIG
ncbi:hypothetical protein F5141DRAFT_1139391 [Pisolithus sp. B1]|nr:hypothetical protein F5141DRAFT_1139391 [Pisolithus sp. B1]